MRGTQMRVVANGMLEFSKPCPITKRVYRVLVRHDSWKKWMDRKLFVQEAFPELNADEREFILSGLTPAEWNALMPEDVPSDETPGAAF